MSDQTTIRKAEFDPKVKQYWLMSGVVVLLITVIFIPLLIFWIPLGLYFTGRFLARMECVLTTKALKVKKGIMVRVEKTIPLEKITDMGMVQGPLMRMFGVNRLTVETAGQSGAGALVSLTGIVDAKSFREAVLEQREIVSGKSSAGAETSSATSPGDDRALGEINETLLRIEKLLSKQAERP